MKLSFPRTAGLLLLSLIAGCGGSGTMSPTSPVIPASTPPVITVANGAFLKNGEPFHPQGLQIRAFVASKQVATAEVDDGTSGFQTALNAQNAFGTVELNAASSWGANMLRFQVSQPSLDPSNTETIVDTVTGKTVPLYDPTYLTTVLAAINQARAAGFVVIVSMQDEDATGTTQHSGLPTQSTLNAWNQLLPSIGSDPDVILELYNEPSPTDTAANWDLWAYGGSLSGNPVLGMQPLINDLRTASVPARNVMILDGLAAAATLDGVPGLATPITDQAVSGISNQLAYAVHPYPRGASVKQSPAAYTAMWDSQFGTFSQQHLVIATEWSASAGVSASSNLGLQGSPSYQIAVDLLNYLVAKRVPLSAGAFDIPGIMIQALDGTYTPSNYDNYASVYQTPTGKNENAGLLVHKLFLSPYPTTVLTCSEGTSSNGVNGATCGQQ